MYTNGMAGWPVFVEAMNSAKQEIVAGNCSILTSNSLCMCTYNNLMVHCMSVIYKSLHLVKCMLCRKFCHGKAADSHWMISNFPWNNLTRSLKQSQCTFRDMLLTTVLLWVLSGRGLQHHTQDPSPSSPSSPADGLWTGASRTPSLEYRETYN